MATETVSKAERVAQLSNVGTALINYAHSASFAAVAAQAFAENGWFSEASVRLAWQQIAAQLTEERLTVWTKNYTLAPAAPLTVGIVAAGNLPLVCWADVLAVLMAGHKVQIKLSSQDAVLPKTVFDIIKKAAPALASQIMVVERLANFNAVIATGGNNTGRYFEEYFGRHPHIIRKNRNSVAVLTGQESQAELAGLGADVFTFFGLGCRSVSALLVPEGYDIAHLAAAWLPYTHLADHHKYANNIDYHRAIFLMNQDKFWDMGLVLLRPDERLYSPLAVLNLISYTSAEQVHAFISQRLLQVQVVVGSTSLWPDALPFGHCQNPGLADYADNIDTLAWLESLGR